MTKVLPCLIIAALLLGGCATKHFGRLAAVSASERQAMSCRDIAIQQIDIDRFEGQVRHKSRIDGASVLAFVGDFGVGNALGKHAALASSAKRRAQLREVALERNCPSDAPQAPRVAGGPSAGGAFAERTGGTAAQGGRSGGDRPRLPETVASTF